MKNNLITSIFALLIIAGCCKNHNTVEPKNIFDGKLKTFELSLSNDSNNIVRNYFFYDSVTFKLKYTNSVILPDTLNTNNITIIYYDFNSITERNNTNSIGITSVINNTVVSLTSLDTVANNEIPLIWIIRNVQHNLDIVNTAGVSLFAENIKNYNYTYGNGNVISHNLSWDEIDFLSNIPTHYIDTITYTYNTEVYGQYIPTQNPFIEATYILSGNHIGGTVGNIVEINGGIGVFKNKNLIKTIKSSKFGYISNYTYNYNSLNQITEIYISNSDGTGKAITYKMTYY